VLRASASTVAIGDPPRGWAPALDAPEFRCRVAQTPRALAEAVTLKLVPKRKKKKVRPAPPPRTGARAPWPGAPGGRGAGEGG
jgi:hypothetical protein